MSILQTSSVHISSLLDSAIDTLTASEIDNPMLNAELLLAHVLHRDRIHLHANPHQLLSMVEHERFLAYINRRAQHEPLQYILGETSFMGLRFNVDRRVLIPRPETEILVEHALKLAREFKPPVHILDIGTGSGAIAVSMAVMCMDAQVEALDVSADALTVARGNADLHGVGRRVTTILGDILTSDVLSPDYHLILSNPPYISSAEFADLQPEVRDFEPRCATTDDADGLTFFRRIAAIGSKHLVPGGIILLEMSYNQAEAVTTMFADSGWVDIQVIPDYNNIPRVMKARRKP
jgi:release factor glutamine methyltransferase